MAIVGDLVVRMGVDNRNMRAGLNASIGSISQVAVVATAVGKAVNIGLDAIGGAIENMEQRITEAFSRMDRISKTSENLGIATEEMGGLVHAASLAGIESEQLTKAMTFMGDVIGEAMRNSNGAQAQLFRDLRLNVDELSKMNAHEQFHKIADALMAVQNQTQKINIARDLFGGRAGAEMLVMLKGGSAGLQAMHRDAVKLGLTFDELSGDKIQAANDAMTRLNASFDGIAQTLAIEIAPHIETMADIVTDVLIPAVKDLDDALDDVAAAVGATGITAALSDYRKASDDRRRIDGKISDRDIKANAKRISMELAAVTIDFEPAFEGFDFGSELDQFLQGLQELPPEIGDSVHDAVTQNEVFTPTGAASNSFEAQNRMVTALNQWRQNGANNRQDPQRQVAMGVNRVAGLMEEQNRMMREQRNDVQVGAFN